MAQTRKSSNKVAPGRTKQATTGAKKSSRKAGRIASATEPGGDLGAASAEVESQHPAVILVRGLAELVATHGLTELVYDTPDLTVTLRRSHGVTEVVPHVIAAPVAPTAMTASAHAAPAAAPAPAEVPAPQKGDDHHIVTSPFVGTFYRRPSPDSDPYADIGSRVQKGQVLCLVEAMKLMNEIEADVAGTVVDILVDDGKPVEYGQPLFKIVPA